MTDYLSAVLETVGSGRTDRPGPAVWDAIEQRQGVTLPADFKTITETYAPVLLNVHLFLRHPAAGILNLADAMEMDIAAMKNVNWTRAGVTFRGAVPVFGGPDGLVPVAGTDRGEMVLLAKPVGADGWHVVVFPRGGSQFVEYEMGFAEWLHRYVNGEPVCGSPSTAHYPGPLRIEDLPLTPSGTFVKRRGPARDR